MSGTIDKLSTCDGQMKQNPQSFKLKHVFKNVPLMEDDDNWDGPTEDHFGIPWNIGISREEDYLAIYLYCERSENKKEWSIDTWFEIHILEPNGNSAHEILDFYFCFTKEDWAYGEERFLTWEKMEEEFLLNDELVVEIRVKINKMTGIEVYLREFNDEECSDVALVVNSNKFHVSKLYLASQSSYFKSMFLGNFTESGKAEIELSGIDEYDFQKYLEMLYGEDALNDETVGGILQLADMYDTKTLIERCEEYLLENSHLTMSGTVNKYPACNNNEMDQKTRSFSLKHVFKNVSKMEDNKQYRSDTEEHYGVPWYISIKHNQDHIGVYLHNNGSVNKKEWSIETKFEINVPRPHESSTSKSISYCFSKAESYGFDEFIKLETMEKEFLLNDELVVEVCVNIIKTTGIEVYLRRFDDEECSDVALLVDGEKFHVSKLYLASQSPYFKSMLLGNFNESGKTDIELTDIDRYDLQKYLELLYGEDALNDETVEGIFQLALKYETQTFIGKCIEYLSEVSRKTLKEKLEMSVKYNITELKKKCISNIRTIDDVRSVIPEIILDMDHTILAYLLEKTLDLSN